jgi:hypothetical protein
MTYTIIGTGNTAWFMATMLSQAGHVCKRVYGRDINKVNELAKTVNGDGHLFSNTATCDADVCIIAVSDYAIHEVASNLQAGKSIVLHTAGAVNINVLSKFEAGHGVIWPVYSIVKHIIPATRSIPTVWEGSNSNALEYIKTIANSYTDILFEADSEKRKWLHLTAVLSNNFTNHLFTIAEKLCAEHNLPFTLLLPIIEQSFSRLRTTPAYSLQTGPAKRNDTEVIKNQIQMLESHPEWRALYQKLTASIQIMYKS